MADSRVTIKWRKAGFYKLRSDPGVQRALESLADEVAGRANSMAGTRDGFRTSSQQGKRKPQGRWRTTVITATNQAKAKNASENILVRALFGG